MKEKKFIIPGGYNSLVRIVSVFTLLISLGSLQDANARDIEFDHLEKNTIFFSSPEGTPSLPPLKTGLFDLSFIGKLDTSNPKAEPYFLFSGKSCSNCSEDRMIYAIRPSGGKPNAFVYPGKILQQKNRDVVLRSYAFLGKCLHSVKDEVLIIYQNEKIDKKHRRSTTLSSVLIAQPSTHYLKETLLEKFLPSMRNTLRLVKNKECREIEGRNRYTMKDLVDLRAPASDQDEDTDTDSDSDSQTESSTEAKNE